MANYYSYCRTNYFKVGKPAEFLEWLETVPDVVFRDKQLDGHDLVGMLCGDNADGAGWPTWRYTDEDEEIEFDIFEEIAEFLAPKEVVIFQEVGAEKLRYLHGQSVAVNSKGDIISLTLNDIHEMVANEWPDHSPPTDCSY